MVVGAIQGVTELFPVSSLGHSVLLPALIGGQWTSHLNVSVPESPYLAFIGGLHVATAATLLVFFWRDRVRIIGGIASSVRHRRVRSENERLAWLIILATIPGGLAGLLLEHLFRTVLGRPIPAAAFLLANGVILLIEERLRRRTRIADAVRDLDARSPVRRRTGDRISGSRRYRFGGGADRSRPDPGILPGISRSGVAMLTGLTQGLSQPGRPPGSPSSWPPR